MTPRERRQHRRDWGVFFLILALIVIAGVAAVAALKAIEGTTRINAEGRERRDQSCTLFERAELTSVNRVRNTYAYLESLPLKDHGTNLTKAIVRGLPDQEREAATTRAPPYCNAPGVGLPEPGRNDCRRLLPSCLDLPEHRDFRELLKPAR